MTDRWHGSSRMWSAWSNQFIWIDFKMRWLIRAQRFWNWCIRKRREYEHPLNYITDYHKG